MVGTEYKFLLKYMRSNGFVLTSDLLFQQITLNFSISTKVFVLL
jgi:hypothetical protein